MAKKTVPLKIISLSEESKHRRVTIRQVPSTHLDFNAPQDQPNQTSVWRPPRHYYISPVILVLSASLQKSHQPILSGQARILSVSRVYPSHCHGEREEAVRSPSPGIQQDGGSTSEESRPPESAFRDHLSSRRHHLRRR